MHFWHGGRPPGGAPKPSSSIPLPKELSTEFRILKPEALRFFREGGSLGLEVDGKIYENVKVVPLFPLSDDEGWISVIDEDGREIGIVERLRSLEPESQRALREELRKRYVVPRILKVRSCREHFGLVEWEVETDRGPRRFLTRNLRETVQRMGVRLMFSDVDGNRYDVPDLRALDPKSRALIERYS